MTTGLDANAVKAILLKRGWHDPPLGITPPLIQEVWGGREAENHYVVWVYRKFTWKNSRHTWPVYVFLGVDLVVASLERRLKAVKGHWDARTEDIHWDLDAGVYANASSPESVHQCYFLPLRGLARDPTILPLSLALAIAKSGQRLIDRYHVYWEEVTDAEGPASEPAPMGPIQPVPAAANAQPRDARGRFVAARVAEGA